MRIALVLAVAALLAAPAAAYDLAQGTAECQRLNFQISHFESMAARAGQLDNALWEQRFDDHVDLLKQRRSQVCPGYSANDELMRQITELLKLAGQGALTFFTLGAL
jgi:hypothetical protein